MNAGFLRSIGKKKSAFDRKSGFGSTDQLKVQVKKTGRGRPTVREQTGCKRTAVNQVRQKCPFESSIIED